MKKVVAELTGWISTFVDLLKVLVTLGVVVGILFDDYFGVVAAMGELMSKFGDAGFAGLLALMIIVFWYNKN